jgi:DNA-binding IclR family transcriptional regulator
MSSTAVGSGENQSVTRAIDILNLLAASSEPLGVREVARRLDLAPSNVQRLIKTLTKAGFLEQTEATMRYKIGYRAFQVAALLHR